MKQRAIFVHAPEFGEMSNNNRARRSAELVVSIYDLVYQRIYGFTWHADKYCLFCGYDAIGDIILTENPVDPEGNPIYWISDGDEYAFCYHCLDGYPTCPDCNYHFDPVDRDDDILCRCGKPFDDSYW
jgi:hypothetical protein